MPLKSSLAAMEKEGHSAASAASHLSLRGELSPSSDRVGLPHSLPFLSLYPQSRWINFSPLPPTSEYQGTPCPYPLSCQLLYNMHKVICTAEVLIKCHIFLAFEKKSTSLRCLGCPLPGICLPEAVPIRNMSFSFPSAVCVQRCSK